MKIIKNPPFVHMEVTPECNHDCIHCYNHWRKDKCVEKFTFDLEKSLNIASKIVQNKPNTVVITGGEPLLVFDGVKELIKLFKTNGINVSINTNATLINDNIIKFAKDYKVRFFISLPSGEESVCDFITGRKGSYQRIVKALDKLYKENVPFNLNMVASKASLKYIKESAELFVKKYCLNKIFITRVGKPVNSDSSFDKYLLSSKDIETLQNICVELKDKLNIQIDTGCPFPLCGIVSQKAFDVFADKKFCTAGKTSYAVDSFGNIKACPRDSKIYGNILEDDFISVINAMEEWRDESLWPDNCKKCSVKHRCQSGCRVDAYPLTGKLNSMDTSSRKCMLPLRFTHEIQKVEPLDIDYVYVLSDEIKKIIEEDWGYRIDTKYTYSYVTKNFFRWISKVKSFDVNDLMSEMSIDKLDEAYYILRKLLASGIIKFL